MKDLVIKAKEGGRNSRDFDSLYMRYAELTTKLIRRARREIKEKGLSLEENFNRKYLYMQSEKCFEEVLKNLTVVSDSGEPIEKRLKKNFIIEFTKRLDKLCGLASEKTPKQLNGIEEILSKYFGINCEKEPLSALEAQYNISSLRLLVNMKSKIKRLAAKDILTDFEKQILSVQDLVKFNKASKEKNNGPKEILICRNNNDIYKEMVSKYLGIDCNALPMKHILKTYVPKLTNSSNLDSAKQYVKRQIKGYIIKVQNKKEELTDFEKKVLLVKSKLEQPKL